MNMTRAPTVIVGLSGGVDSAVSALLLKQQGFNVQGLFMKNWEEDDTSTYCSAEKDLLDVKSICKKLGIPLHTANFSQEYWENVFSYFLDEYQKGRTPNPDILCNKEIKFKAFLHQAIKLGADFIATGHYVQNKAYNDNEHHLVKGVDPNKDQSYFLYTLNQEALKMSLFPIGQLEKSEVRRIAKNADLVNHAKKDSTGICFIGERKFKAFLQDYLKNHQGNICTPEGIALGRHDGLMYYTLGQRKGLNIGGKKDALEKPWYVVGKSLTNNILYVSQEVTHPWHFCRKLIANHLHFINEFTFSSFPLLCRAKIRYRQADQRCKISLSPSSPNSPSINEVIVEFMEPQRAVAPGQSIVFYEGNRCLGGGIIHATDSPGGLREQNQFNKDPIS